MSLSRQYVMYNELNSIIKTITKNNILKLTIIFSQFLSLIILFLIKEENNFLNYFDPGKSFIQKLNQNVFTDDIANLGSIAACSISHIFAVTLVLKAYYGKTIRPVKKVKLVKLFKLAHIFLVIIWICMEISVYFSFWCFSRVYQTRGISSFILRSIFFIIVYTYINKKFTTGSIYQLMTLKIAISLTMFENRFIYILILIFSLYFIYKKNSKIQKLTLIIISLTSVIILRNQLFLINSSEEADFVLILLGLMILAVCVLIYFAGQNLRFQTDKTSHYKNCLNILKRTSFDNIQYGIEYEDMVKLYIEMNSIKEIQQLYHSQDSSESMKDKYKILSKSFIQFKFQDYYTLISCCLMDKLSKQSLSINDQTQIKALLLQIKLNLSAKKQVQTYDLIKEMYSLIKDCQKVEKSQIKEQVFDLFAEVKKKLLRTQSEINQIEIILDLARTKNEKQQKEIEFVAQIRQFWSFISSPLTSKPQIDSSLTRLQTLQSKIKNLHHTSSFLQNSKAISGKIQYLLNPYINTQEFSEQYAVGELFMPSSLSQFMLRKVHNFILFEQSDKIVDISQKLLKKLCFLNKNDSTKEYSLSSLIGGQQFFQIIRNKIANIQPLKENDQPEQFILPICSKNGTIELMTATLLWFPSVSKSAQYLLTFSQKQQLSKEPFILYSLKEDSITFFNQIFMQEFHLSPDLVFDHIKQPINISFNEMFSDLGSFSSSNQLKVILEEQKQIPCKINVEKFIDMETRLEQQKNGKIPRNNNVEISGVFSIFISQDESYYVIKVSRQNSSSQRHSNYFSSETSSSTGNKDGSDMILQIPNEIALKNSYKDQKFFCKIPSPYQTKINEKLSQIQQKNRFKCIYFVYLIFAIIFAVMLSGGVLDFTVASKRNEMYRKVDVQIDNVSQQYALIYQSYSAAFKKYLINAYPNQCLMVRKAPPIVFLTIYNKIQQGFIDQFLTRYLPQLRPPAILPAIQYNLTFPQYKIQSSTYSSTLIDFAQQIKNNQLSNQIKFLFQNYDSFRETTVKHEQLLAEENMTEGIIRRDELVQWVVGGVLVFLMMICLGFVMVVEMAVWDVYRMVQAVDAVVWDKAGDKVTEVIDSIDSDNCQNQTQKPNDDQKKLSYVSLLQAQPSAEVPSSSKQLSPQTRNSIIMPNQLPTTQQKPSKKSPHTNKLDLSQPFITKLNRFSFFIISFIIFVAVSYRDHLQLANEKQGMNQVFEIKKKMYRALLQIKREETDAMIKPMAEHYFRNDSSYIPVSYHNTSSIQLLDQVSQKNIKFEVMDKFVKETYQAMSGNLCDIPMKYKAQIIPCEKYANGLLIKGINMVLSRYKQYGRITGNLKLVQFGSRPCSLTSGCPPAYQHEYISIKLGQTARYFLQNFSKEMIKVYSYLENEKLTKMSLKFVGAFLFVIGFIMWNYEFAKRRRIALKLFLMIPKDIVGNVHVVRYMKMTKLLDKLGYL